MKKIILVMAIAGLLGVTGCATSPAILAKQEEFIRTIPICTNEKDCNEKWEAAQLWVVHNAAFKIQISTNVLIETYNAPSYSPHIAVRVTKEPIGGGKYQFIVSVWCANALGCNPDSWDAALDFNRTVGAGSGQAKSSNGKAVLGISYRNLPTSGATGMQHANMKGVLVVIVASGSVAEKAGINVGDVIYEYDGKPITGTQDVQPAVDATHVGNEVPIKVLRGSENFSLNAKF